MSTPNPTVPSDIPAGKPRTKRRFFTLRNLIILLLIVIALPPATEIGLRFLGFGNPVLYTDEPGLEKNGCGYFLAANQDTTRLFARNKTNRWGMRCDDFPDHKDPTHYRVLFIGDSVTYGTTFVDQPDIFTSILQRELPTVAGEPVDVLNASAGGWAPANEINFLRSRGAYDADLVIFVFNTGDLTQGFNKSPEPLSSPRKKPLTALGEVWGRYILPRLSAVNTEDAGAVPQGVPELSDVHALDTLDRALDYCQTIKSPSNHFHGIRMAILFTPAHGSVWDQPGYEAIKQKLVKWSADHAVPLIDLAPDFTPPYDKLYFGDDAFIHLRPAGHRIVADRLKREWPALTR